MCASDGWSGARARPERGQGAPGRVLRLARARWPDALSRADPAQRYLRAVGDAQDLRLDRGCPMEERQQFHAHTRSLGARGLQRPRAHMSPATRARTARASLLVFAPLFATAAPAA